MNEKQPKLALVFIYIPKITPHMHTHIKKSSSRPSYTFIYPYGYTYEDTYSPACHPHQKILYKIKLSKYPH